MNQEDFFSLVWGGLEGEVRISIKGISNGRWFTWPTQKNALLEYVEEHKDGDVYFSTSVYSRRTRRAQYATAGNVVYADADECNPKNFRLNPSITLQTSPGNWQAFWILDKEEDPKDISEVSHLIAAGHASDGCDKSGWITTKLLRVPDTTHTKTETHHKVTGFVSGEMYSLDEIRQAYADVDLDEAADLDLPVPTEIPDYNDLAGDGRMTAPLWTFWSTPPEAGADLSARMWRLELDLFRAGFSTEEVFALVRGSLSNKYSPDRFGEATSSGGVRPHRENPDADLWTEILRASVRWKGGEAEPVQVEDDDLFLEANLRFLTDEEETQVNNTHTFIDRYVKWAKSRTDASVEYHQALGFLVLSCIYGDKATLHLSFGVVRLNLWVMLLGDTTKTRKSTARRLMLEVVHAYEKAIDEKIDVGSDFTPEALTRALGDRDMQSSLVHRDEVQGYFNELFHKHHHAGSVERLTDMYDGKVPVVLRNSADKAQNNRATTIFNMLLMGIGEQTARVLTVDHFRSGFLTRFLWVSAPDLPMTDDRLEIKQGDPNAPLKGGTDMQVHTFVSEFLKANQKMPRSEMPIYLTDEALARINQWIKWMIKDVVPKTREPKNLEPTVQRMAQTIMKCGALLALHDRKREVGVEYILVGLKYAEEWFEALREMSDSIADSEFSQHVNDIETFVYEGGGSRLMSAVYSRFRAYPVRDLDMWVESLVSQGRATLNGQRLVLRKEAG